MLNVACFVQSCLTDADFVIFLNYCLIGTRLSRGCFFFGCGNHQPCRRRCSLKAFPSIDEQPSEPQAEVLIEEFMQADALIGGIRVNRTQVSRLRVENRKEIKFGGF